MPSPSAISTQPNRDLSLISLCTCLFFCVGADFGDFVAQLWAKGSNILWGIILHWQRKWMQRVVGEGYLEAFRRLGLFFSAVTLLISADSRKLLSISNTDSLD